MGVLMNAGSLTWLMPAAVASLLALVACGSALTSPTVAPEAPHASAAADLWSRLLEQDPYPYSTPLPPAQDTVVDGTYNKFDPREGTRPFCRRCMPYPAEGGTWRLQLDQGVYRILSTRSLSGWRSLGSFAVSGDQMMLFNDPHCMEDVGIYRWQLGGQELRLEVIEDECADGWRGVTFTNYAWTAESPQGGG